MNSFLLTTDQEDYICKNYYNKTSNSLSKELGCSPSLITKIWTKYQLRGKKNYTYILNQKYFEKIDTIDKAYFLGFIAADGCVYDNHKENSQNIIRIVIHKDDIDVLEKLKKYIETEKPINKNHQYVVLELVSDILYKDINNLGLHPRKTYKNTIVNLEDNYMRHFIRGYFDGDGSISKSKRDLIILM